MGRLIYSGTLTLEVDERTLAHLQAVMERKLRDRAGLHFAWQNEGIADSVGWRNVIWVHSGISLIFAFSSSQVPRINREWITELR